MYNYRNHQNKHQKTCTNTKIINKVNHAHEFVDTCRYSIKTTHTSRKYAKWIERCIKINKILQKS